MGVWEAGIRIDAPRFCDSDAPGMGRTMMKRLWIVCGLLLPSAALACSSGAGGDAGGDGGSGAACPAAGSKACPNDPPFSSQDSAACQTCLAQLNAVVACDPAGTANTCDANGMSATYSPPASCQSQYTAFTACYSQALPGSGSGGDGGVTACTGTSNGSMYCLQATWGGVTCPNGTPVASCPLDAIGCCRTTLSSGYSESCTYDPLLAPEDQAGCTGVNQTWVASP